MISSVTLYVIVLINIIIVCVTYLINVNNDRWSTLGLSTLSYCYSYNIRSTLGLIGTLPNYKTIYSIIYV